MALPWAIGCAQLAYRKSWFDEVGYPARQVPQTWEEYRRRHKAQGERTPYRPDTRSHLRRCAHLRLWLTLVVGQEGGGYRAVHLRSTACRRWRALLTARRMVLNRRRDIENGVRALLREAGLKVCTPSRKDFSARV